MTLKLPTGVLCSAPAFGVMGALLRLNSGADGLKFLLLTALLFISASANGAGRSHGMKQSETQVLYSPSLARLLTIYETTK